MDGDKSERKQPVVRLGRLLFKENVPTQLAAAGVTLDHLVRRHQTGDWGMVDDDEQEYLDWAAAQGKTVTSSFVVRVEGKALSVFISTEEKITYVVVV